MLSDVPSDEKASPVSLQRRCGTMLQCVPFAGNPATPEMHSQGRLLAGPTMPSYSPPSTHMIDPIDLPSANGQYQSACHSFLGVIVAPFRCTQQASTSLGPASALSPSAGMSCCPFIFMLQLNMPSRASQHSPGVVKATDRLAAVFVITEVCTELSLACPHLLHSK